jgi:prepilin-type N-terminal cleavage/methylation domain-containing protein
MKYGRYHYYGFTLIELLIVITVIAILAAITIVAYAGITGRANDVAVETDLHNDSTLLIANELPAGSFPNTELALSTQGLRVAENSYGNPILDGSTGYAYNLLYCSTVDGYQPSSFALIGSSKSGNVYSVAADGNVVTFPKASWTGGWGTICPAILGVSAGNSATGIWLYENSIWKSWL